MLSILMKTNKHLGSLYSDLRHGVGFPKISINCSWKSNLTIITFFQILVYKVFACTHKQELNLPNMMVTSDNVKLMLCFWRILYKYIWLCVQKCEKWCKWFTDCTCLFKIVGKRPLCKSYYIFSQKCRWMHYFCIYGYQNMTEVLTFCHRWTGAFTMLFSLVKQVLDVKGTCLFTLFFHTTLS